MDDGKLDALGQTIVSALPGVATAHAVAFTPLFDVVRQAGEETLVKLAPDATNNEVLQYFMQQGVSIQSFNEVLPSLNDIFIRLVEGTPTARQFEAV